MAYIEKQKFNVHELAASRLRPIAVAIIEPDEYLAALYARYISAAHLQTHMRHDVDGIHGFIKTIQPHIIIINPNIQPSPKIFISILNTIRENFPAILLVTIGLSSDSEAIKDYMDSGISSHINRAHTRPQDVVVIIKSLLHH